jgi:hypothetical protein
MDTITLFYYIKDMKNVHSIQYTIRGIPQKVNQYLIQKAKEEKKSLNKVIIECLIQSLTLPQGKISEKNNSPIAWPGNLDLEKMTEYLDFLDNEFGKQ